MPTCQNCHQKWTWKQTLKRATITFAGGMTCPYCKEKQYMSTASRKKAGIYYAVFPILIIIPLNVFFDLSIGTAVILAIILIVIMLGINPFMVELSNEEEPLF